VSVIVFGVILASIGEIKFVLVGVIFQLGGIIFEALRLTMVQRLLSSADFKMDPMVSLYYFAPVCAAMNLVVALAWEVPKITMAEVYNVGLFTFLLNGICAFMLNVSVVLLVSLESFSRFTEHMLTSQPDWENLCPRPHALWCSEGHSLGCTVHDYLGYPRLRPPILRLWHCSLWHGLLQAWIRCPQELR